MMFLVVLGIVFFVMPILVWKHHLKWMAKFHVQQKAFNEDHDEFMDEHGRFMDEMKSFGFHK